MSDHSSGAEQGALPPTDGSPSTPTRVPALVGVERSPLQLAQVIGGQYIITSQSQSGVPPLTQIVPNTATSPISRIINISSIRTSNLSNQSIVNALTKPRTPNIRTQLFPTSIGPGGDVTGPGEHGIGQGTSGGVSRIGASGVHGTHGASAIHGAPQGTGVVRKRSRADEMPPGCEMMSGNRARAMEHKWARSKCIKESYYEHIAELYFLETSGNMLDYYSWRKKPRTSHYTSYLLKHQLDASDLSQEELPASQTSQQLVLQQQTLQRLASPKPEVVGNISVGSTLLAAPITQTESTLVKVPETPNLMPIASVQPPSIATTITTVTTTVLSSASTPKTSTTTAVSTVTKTKSIVSTLSSGSQEQIVEKAKQEAYVMQRVSELQKEGLWTERRLPKVQETSRCKSHWDYLLEEMVWLAADFAQERKWKKAAAKKCARMVQKYFQDKALAAQKAEKAQELQLRRIASFIAKEIKTFWNNVEKLVEFKQQTRLEEKRKKALDQHLSFIVDQTEKYSQLLAKDMNKSLTEPQSTSIPSSRVPSPHSDDDEFRPDDNSSDDEETIAQAEAADVKEEQSEEVAALQRESEMNLEEFLSELPKDYLEMRDKIKLPEEDDEVEEKSSVKVEIEKDPKKKLKDDEFTVDSEAETEDDEDTIMEQEEKEKDEDHKQEIDELQAENEMSIEELMKKYSAPLPEDDKMSVDEEQEESEEETSEEEEESEEETSEDEQETNEAQSDDEVGLKSLLEDEIREKNKTEGDDHLINDVAAIAESIQPKGNTLSSTNVVTPVPFLLKHSLREYQHIGLDWLVTMFERKLNGILADEMGLGKTIQTIALLAHLACVKGDWGPHLIIVPTSVMLNWEMECKKWCPGFKILTYYGTQKERKLKRTGWTKPNAFHICITSYKLVIQDHQSFRRKKWKYLILDEAQNIKNFKSQRWQLLLNFQTQQRLLLTGTPLQNNLMELWSLMHFLMPNVFQSHREFREWFSNPVTGMIEGNSEYNESIIKRLHKVLRPFLLRRLKSEVEKQMPKKFEHIIMCRLSKRQRFLYDDYMSRAKTRETLSTGNLLSVINVLMQLRKVCNHPNLFEIRPTVSPFQMEGLIYNIPSLVYSVFDRELFERVDFNTLHLQLMNLELNLTAYGAYRTCKYRAPAKLIECIDSIPEPPPKCPSGLVRMRVKHGEPSKVTSPARLGTLSKPNSPGKPGTVKVSTSPVQQGLKLRVTGPTGAPLQGYSVQLVQHQGSVKAIPVATLSSGQQAAVTSPSLALKPVGGPVKTEQRVSVGGFAQLVQTPMGKHILLTQNAALPAASTVAIGGTTTVLTSSGQRLTVLSKPVTTVTSSLTTSPNKALTNSTAVVAITSSPLSSTQVSSTTSTVNATELVTNSVDPNAPVSISRPLTASLVQQLKSVPTSSGNNTGMKRRSSSQEEKKEDEKIDPLKIAYNEKVQHSRENKLAIILRFNEWRCQASPMYGGDLRDSLTMRERATTRNPWIGAYLTLQQAAAKTKPWLYGKTIQDFVHTPTDYVTEMTELFNRYVFCVPAVSAPPLSYRVLNPPQAKYWAEQRDTYILQRELSPKAAVLHPIASAMVTQFPDPRLIQYDCGKLQTLDLLLRKLKVGSHRVLIFTQMTRMLDVLEAFLNFHGHIYLRLDGTTKVDQRQLLMERFNGDKRIFAFILSTRSGGVGVNLTGADTVIFYDSDWNPTMDAQAQDRCHRIGQTRDVHIYRLVSEKTIEENILKKANQKRMLGDLAIEGGNFTTAYFKSSTIQDLFNVDAAEEDASARMDLPKARPPEPVVPPVPSSSNPEDRAALGALENALAACEDDQDVQAARTAKAEAVADLAEFDESIPLEEGGEKEEMSKAEIEVQNLIKQLTPVERYAMRFVEETEAAWSAEQLAAAEREIEEQKREWEENRLAALRKEEERRKGSIDDEAELLTFSREDSTNQIWLSYNNKEQMPLWCPPTPPQQDTDMYIDYTMGFLYEMSVMSESQLPPVYIRKESNKRSRHDAGLTLDAGVGRRAVKVSRKDDVYEPRSLFDRPSPEMMKMRREIKQQRYRGIIRPQMPKLGLKLASLTKPTPDPPCWHNWTIHEDMSLLKVIQTFQGLSLNLLVVSPGHTANWDFAADYVNTTSITYRSPKQCRHRYETVLINREEGKILYDTSSRKKKNKNIYTKFPQQIKSNRPMRTAQLHTQDNNSTFSQLMISRYDSLKTISLKRPVSSKPPAANPLMKNPKHTAVLTECGIDYERPLLPTEVAARRTDRLREKQKLGALTSESARKASTSTTSQSTVSQPTSIVPASPSTSSVQNTTAIVPTQQTVAVSVANIQAPGTPPGTIRTQRIVASPMQNTAVVSVAGLTQAHLAQRLIVTGQTVTKAPVSGTATVAATSKTITPAQLQFYRQQALKQQMKLQAAGIQGQTVKGTVSVAGQPTVQVAVSQAGQQRTQFVRQTAVTVATGGKQGITRTVSETEMAALIKRQQQLQQQKALQAAAQAQANQGTTVQTLTQAQQAQILAQAGIQVQQSGSGQPTQVATLVKAVSSAPTSTVTIPVSIGTSGKVQGTSTTTTIKPQQLRQLQIHQQLLAQKKLTGQKITQLAQVAGKAGVATQLIVQAPKTIPAAMTVQQLQQVMRQQGPPQLAVSQGQVVLAKAGPQGRVIPVNTSLSQAGLKQTIQVVTASSQALTSGIRPQVTSTLASALAGTIKVASSTSSSQQQAILSQVSAALHQGQPVTVRQSGSPVRIQTTSGQPLVAVTVQSGTTQQSASGNEQTKP